MLTSCWNLCYIGLLRTLIFGAFIYSISAGASQAQSNAFRECTDYSNSPNIRIHNCTIVIDEYNLFNEYVLIAYNNRGVALREIGKLTEAIEDYSTIIEKSNKPPANAFLIGRVRLLKLADLITRFMILKWL